MDRHRQVDPEDHGPNAPPRSELLAELVESGALVPVAVEGIRGDRFVLAEEVADARGGGGRDAPATDAGMPGVAFLAPLDPFVWDRDFLRSLYDFDYVWEVYVPAAKRRWGYYVLPILFGDRLVGRIEPRIDRRAGTLRVIDLWWEDGFDPMATEGFVPALVEALEALRALRERETGRPAADDPSSVARSGDPRSPRPGWPDQRLIRIDLPGAPVAGLVAGPDADFPVVGPSPGHGLAGRGGRDPTSAHVPPTRRRWTSK